MKPETNPTYPTPIKVKSTQSAQ